jgi:hypothetical protein
MKDFKLHQTRIAALPYINVKPGLWRIVDAHNNSPKSFWECHTVGPQYKSKIELLTDFDRYSRETWGY